MKKLPILLALLVLTLGCVGTLAEEGMAIQLSDHVPMDLIDQVYVLAYSPNGEGHGLPVEYDLFTLDFNAPEESPLFVRALAAVRDAQVVPSADGIEPPADKWHFAFLYECPPSPTQALRLDVYDRNSGYVKVAIGGEEPFEGFCKLPDEIIQELADIYIERVCAYRP